MDSSTSPGEFLPRIILATNVYRNIINHGNKINVGCTSSTTQTQVSIAGVITNFEDYERRIRMLSGDGIIYTNT